MNNPWPSLQQFLLLVICLSVSDCKRKSEPGGTKPSNHWLTTSEKTPESMNFEGAYEQGLSGKGVIVGIADSFIDFQHRDIKESIVLLLLNLIMIPQRYSNSKRATNIKDRTKDFDNSIFEKNLGIVNHGTHVASIVAGRKESYSCSPGLAPDSKIELLRTPFGNKEDFYLDTVVLYDTKTIDIYIFAWGVDDDGMSMGNLNKKESSALNKATKTGRNGNGNIYIVSSGNGGRNFDDCNCDAYPSSIYTISVGMIGLDMNIAFFQEHCSAMLTAIPDIYNRYSVADYIKPKNYELESKENIQRETAPCVKNFTGTSAAAPILASAIALALEARPDLGYRDVQHLIVESSSIPAEFKEKNPTKINGAGHEFNEFIGFGLLDVGEMTKLAKSWKIKKELEKCTVKANKAFFKTNSKLIILFDADECKIQNVESVILTFSADMTNNRSTLGVKIISPSRTSSNVLTPRHLDKKNFKFTKRPLKSVHFWNEKASGKWFALFKDIRDNMSDERQDKFISIRKKDVELLIYGT
ncbi:MAG: Neuroendocrine convertase 1 [Marteilia pararefringens]